MGRALQHRAQAPLSNPHSRGEQANFAAMLVSYMTLASCFGKQLKRRATARRLVVVKAS